MSLDDQHYLATVGVWVRDAVRYHDALAGCELVVER